MTYLQYYISCILALQDRARTLRKDKKITIPLAIMTSGDTDERTRKLLKDNNNFGMDTDQLFIIVQGKVPAMMDNDAHFAQDPKDPYSLITKPHGHGDVHLLLHTSGLASRWKKEGRQWVVFFQDTNALVFRCLCAALGVSTLRKMAVNSLAVPRKPGEAVGAIMKLTKKIIQSASSVTSDKDKKERKEDTKCSTSEDSLTINVEYNQLETMVKHEPLDNDGFSKYPGNINILILAIPSYAENLEKTSGIIAEFINPKYADSSRNKFKKDARLECMMQDYPKLLQGTNALVGFTQFERWLSFSAVKNSILEAQAKQKSNIATECASSGEADYYYYFRKVLAMRSGVKLSIEGEPKIYSGIKTWQGAHVVLTPRFGICQADIQSKFGQNVSISDKSTLILDGDDITVKNLVLDGTLIIHAVPGAHVAIQDLTVKNDGWVFTPIKESEKVDPSLAIRGYRLEKKGQMVLNYNSSGTFLLSDKTKPISI
eukprot:TRINITY_DN1733_c0_g1_i1.p1 TRINITY_DN1733_c0_g1~~TRINITY_DN1733_c0_g1_i1.p1  ORF type:complete len:523 (-),score=97.57 TRINITY_DN1733_c0_g1_i1:190-1647(-)